MRATSTKTDESSGIKVWRGRRFRRGVASRLPEATFFANVSSLITPSTLLCFPSPPQRQTDILPFPGSVRHRCSQGIGSPVVPQTPSPMQAQPLPRATTAPAPAPLIATSFPLLQSLSVIKPLISEGSSESTGPPAAELSQARARVSHCCVRVALLPPQRAIWASGQGTRNRVPGEEKHARSNQAEEDRRRGGQAKAKPRQVCQRGARLLQSQGSPQPLPSHSLFFSGPGPAPSSRSESPPLPILDPLLTNIRFVFACACTKNALQNLKAEQFEDALNKEVGHNSTSKTSSSAHLQDSAENVLAYTCCTQTPGAHAPPCPRHDASR